MESRWLSDSSELGNIHHCGFVSGSRGFVGGIVGEPKRSKGFYDVAEVDSGTLCQELSRCYSYSLFLWHTYSTNIYIEVQKAQRKSRRIYRLEVYGAHILLICKAAFPLSLAEGMLSII